MVGLLPLVVSVAFTPIRLVSAAPGCPAGTAPIRSTATIRSTAPAWGAAPVAAPSMWRELRHHPVGRRARDRAQQLRLRADGGGQRDDCRLAHQRAHIR